MGARAKSRCPQRRRRCIICQQGLADGCTIVDPLDMTRRKTLQAGLDYDDLLVPIFDGGRRVYDPPPLADIRRRAGQQLACLDETVKRFVHPHQYPAGLEEGLFDTKTQLIMSARRSNA